MSGVSKAWLETWHPPYQRLQEVGLMDLTRGSSQPKQNSCCLAPGKQVAAGALGTSSLLGAFAEWGYLGGLSTCCGALADQPRPERVPY